MADLIDSYSQTNVDSDTFVLTSPHPSTGALFSSAGQAFTMPITAYILTSCKFYLKKVGAPIGNVTAALYACTGTPGTNGKGIGSALATSDNLLVTGLTESYALYEFTFSTPFNLEAATNYCIVFLNSPTTGIDASNYPVVGSDASSPSHGGNTTYYNGDSGWMIDAGSDVAFYLYGNRASGYLSTKPKYW